MALSKLTYNSLNVTAAASKGIGFDSDPDALQADYTGGAMVLIKKITASSSATVSFVDGASDVVLDNTYKEYLFTFKDIHPEETDRNFTVNFSADSGSNYNVTKTTTFFRAYHGEDDSAGTLEYASGSDVAQGTGTQDLMNGIKHDNDGSGAGYLHLFNPSSTTFVKHFVSVTNIMQDNTQSFQAYIAGYCNTTSAVDAVQFKMSSGDIDAGDICLYGIN